MMMMNCFCGMVDRQNVFRLIFSRGHCQGSSPPLISDTPRAGFEPVQNLSYHCSIDKTLVDADYSALTEEIESIQKATKFNVDTRVRIIKN